LSQVCPELFFHRTWRGPATLCESEKLPALCSRHRSEPPQNASKIQIRSSGFSPTRDFVAARGLARQESLIRSSVLLDGAYRPSTTSIPESTKPSCAWGNLT